MQRLENSQPGTTNRIGHGGLARANNVDRPTSHTPATIVGCHWLCQYQADASLSIARSFTQRPRLPKLPSNTPPLQKKTRAALNNSLSLVVWYVHHKSRPERRANIKRNRRPRQRQVLANASPSHTTIPGPISRRKSPGVRRFCPSLASRCSTPLTQRRLRPASTSPRPPRSSPPLAPAASSRRTACSRSSTATSSDRPSIPRSDR